VIELKREIKVTDTTLRDAHQSLLATRMKIEDMKPILRKIDDIGYHSLEVWGGATFDSCLRFLNENPWERLRTIRASIKKTKLQMLLRGQNVVGYKHYPDDVVENFIIHAKKNGIDIFRIFDALNDPRNMRFAMEICKRENSHVQACLSYTISPLHNKAFYLETAEKLVNIETDSICIKDMAGMIAPKDAYELVSGLKSEFNLPVQLHSHYTSGMASVAYFEAIKAGVDVIDTAVSSMAMGTSQPPVETMIAMLNGTEYAINLDEKSIEEVTDYFNKIRKNYARFEMGSKGISASVLRHGIPGGMMSNLINQLRENDMLDLLPRVLAEVPVVRKELGYPPLVTPTSQIVGSQATFNVMTGKRYSIIPKEVTDYVKGFYGKSPGNIDPEIKQKILGDEKEINERPADFLEPLMEKARAEIADLTSSEEDIISYALFPDVTRDYLSKHDKGEGYTEVELVAAALSVFVALERKKKSKIVLKKEGTGRRTNVWALAGRLENMRYRGFL